MRETHAKMNREWLAFKSFVIARKTKTKWDKLLASEISSEEVDHLISDFLFARVNKTHFSKTGVKVRLDPNTMGSLVSRLLGMIQKNTNYRPVEDSRFQQYKMTLRDYNKESAKRPGVGQLMDACDPFTTAEICWMMQSPAVSLFRPWGLVQGLYLLAVVVFNLRVKEASQLTFGNFEVIKIGGKDSYIRYIPGTSKTKQGDKRPSGRQGVLTSKRPVAPLSTDPSFNLANFLAEHKRRLPLEVLQEYQGRMEDCPLWWRVRGDSPMAQLEIPFYLNMRMGSDTFNTLVRKMVSDSGLDTGDRKIANSSLRCSTFNIQENLCIDATSRQAISGHSSTSTSEAYLRKNLEKNHNMGSSIQEAITGAGCVQIDFEAVFLINGQKVYPRRAAYPSRAELLEGGVVDQENVVPADATDDDDFEEDTGPGFSTSKPAIKKAKTASHQATRKSESVFKSPQPPAPTNPKKQRKMIRPAQQKQVKPPNTQNIFLSSPAVNLDLTAPGKRVLKTDNLDLFAPKIAPSQQMAKATSKTYPGQNEAMADSLIMAKGGSSLIMAVSGSNQNIIPPPRLGPLNQSWLG